MNKNILILGLIASFNAKAESHCDQWCTDGVICDCEWNAASNTLTINSGSFTDYVYDDDGTEVYVAPFAKTDYNINVVGNNISWGEDAFSDTSGNINYSGDGANFDASAFYQASGNITYSGNNANFYDGFWGASGNITITGNNIDFGEGFGFFSGNAYLLGENIDLATGGYVAEEGTGNFTVSPAVLRTMFNLYRGFKGQIYCTEDLKCLKV